MRVIDESVADRTALQGATNRDLRKAVECGEFRDDFFYRLGVFDIQIPPLRDRLADIVPLQEVTSCADRVE